MQKRTPMKGLSEVLNEEELLAYGEPVGVTSNTSSQNLVDVIYPDKVISFWLKGYSWKTGEFDYLKVESERELVTGNDK